MDQNWSYLFHDSDARAAEVMIGMPAPDRERDEDKNRNVELEHSIRCELGLVFGQNQGSIRCHFISPSGFCNISCQWILTSTSSLRV